MPKLHCLLVLVPLLGACGSPDEPDEPKTCDEACRDEIAARALRETIKLVYNLALQGNLVGLQVEQQDCPLGGSALVTGFATSNADQGTTAVTLDYELDECAYLQRDDDVDENYDMVISGTVHETGIIAVQPTATTALIFEASSLSLEGTVFDPPSSYSESNCDARLAQDGNRLSGTWCNARKLGFDL